MNDETPLSPGERILTLRYPAVCRNCQGALPAKSRAVWDASAKTARCLTCAVPAQPSAPVAEALDPEEQLDFGTPGGSAQRLFDAKEARRRARLRSRWWILVVVAVICATAAGFVAHGLHTSVALWVVLGGVLPVLDLLRRPQHIDAWRSGAVGERLVGCMLDGLRAKGVMAVHDRRVPGRRTNIDHIAISTAGIFVVDAKNVAGKVRTGSRQDKMVAGVRAQVDVVRQALADQPLDPSMVRGVLCFTRADLPWLRPSPRGVQLLYPRGLRKQLLRSGTLPPAQVASIAELLARRLPAA